MLLTMLREYLDLIFSKSDLAIFASAIFVFQFNFHANELCNSYHKPLCVCSI